MSYTNGHKNGSQNPHALTIRFPQRIEEEVAQDEEWCEVIDGDIVTRLRFHDYAQIFGVPGLYNQLFGGANSDTKCISPQVLAEMLNEHLHHVEKKDEESAPSRNGHPAKVRVLDFGAGNGMIGEEVRLLVSSHKDRSLADSTLLVGFDILPEAKLAAERDRPGVYDAYIVADITKYVNNTRTAIEQYPVAEFNVLVSASALSFGDASADAFRAAISLVQIGGLVLFNLKVGLLDHKLADVAQDQKTSVDTRNGFSGLIQQAVDNGRMEILMRKTYRHRLSVTGKPLYYTAVVAIKRKNLE
ncbi:unnamed protein product [Discula destructiva]